MANVLKSLGVRKGDTVCIYLPNCPECAFAMLACARIGAIHSVVFGGFSSEALGDRIIDAQCKILITADEGLRGGKIIPLKRIASEAIARCHSISKVLVLKKTGNSVPWDSDKDIWLNDIMATMRPYCPAESMNSEDPLFFLYTSGSTGKPKGIQHSSAGYLLYTAITFKYVFDIRPNDIYASISDVGWITGHSYIVYGPLANGATTFMFESLPTYPDPGRYWNLVQTHKITQFYTAPTAIRTLMKFEDSFVTKYDRSSLRILGSVGEPINPESFRWYYNIVGQKQCSIVDTYWQTESGGHLLTPLPGCVPQKAGSCCLPFFGIKPEIIDGTTGNVIDGNGVSGVLAIATPWPGIARTIFKDHQRYLTTYMHAYKNKYFTGDGAHRDKDGYYWISGRVDDVINVSGHRIGTAEVESALVQHPACAESAVVGVPHDIKGQTIFAFCILKSHYKESDELIVQLKQEVRKHIGGFAVPEAIIVVSGLPKTRSGKIMRRILRKIAHGEHSTLGDLSTIADPEIVEVMIKKMTELKKH